jgi:hypothetical protein
MATLKGIGTPETKLAALAIYRENKGRKVDAIVALINKKLKIKITARTFYSWRKDGDWDGKIERANALAAGRAPDGSTISVKVRSGLLNRFNEYEVFFASLKGKPPKAMDMFAYVSVVKALVLLDKGDKKTADALDAIEEPAAARKKARQVMEDIYGIRQ